MAGAWTTIEINGKTFRVWDESGTKAGPFIFGQMQADGAAGGGEGALEAGNLATVVTETTAIAGVAGTIAGAAVVTDANGTLQQYLRGLIKLVAAIISVKLQDGSGNALTSTSQALDVNIKSGVNTNGRKTPANSAPIVAASQTAIPVAVNTTLTLGPTGGAGDWLDFVVIQPGTPAAAAVSIIDGSTTIYTWPGGGTTALLTLAPIVVPIRAICATAWKITTGATNVTAIGVGNFTT